jgi:hypothetical protein
MRRTAMVLAVAALLTGVLVACESPAAQRELAQAERIRAEAQAYERQRAADAAAYAERAAVRQMERDAAHERTLDTLPFVLAIGGGVLLALAIVVGGILLWREQSLRAAQPQPAPTSALATTPQPATLDDLWAYLQQREAALWHALAILARRQPCPEPPAQTGLHGENLLDSDERR